MYRACPEMPAIRRVLETGDWRARGICRRKREAAARYPSGSPTLAGSPEGEP